MIVGDPSQLAIESAVTTYLDRPSQRALGFFLIHVAGHCFGVRSPDATCLACSFNEVGRRVADRGTHTAGFADAASASAIANAYFRVLFAGTPPGERVFGMTTDEFEDLITDHQIVWAPMEMRRSMTAALFCSSTRAIKSGSSPSGAATPSTTSMPRWLRSGWMQSTSMDS